MKIRLPTLFSGARITRIDVKLSVVCAWLLVLLMHGYSLAQTVAPRIFFSDLTSGPATGGQDGQGAFVTIYGSGFGASRDQSYITIAGIAAASYPVWTKDKISFQLGRDAKSGQIAVHTSNGGQSNEVPFTVRSGRILFLSAKDGKESLSAAVAKLKPGDILYLRDGYKEASLDRYDAALNVMASGRQGEPIALVAYPGATVTIGSAGAPQIAARTPNVDRTSDHWVISGIHFLGYQEALDVTDSKDWRVIGNDFSCPNGFGPTGCIEFSQASEVVFLGNVIHDVAPPQATKAYHALYFTTDSNHIDVGWNTISNVRGCRAIQFHSTPLDRGTGHNQYDLHVHDNIIHDVVCDGINFATVDPSMGTVEAYNNLLYNVGEGPDPPDGSSNYSCIYIQGGSNAGAPGSGVVEIYNNTMYRCGGRHNTDSGAIALAAGSPNQSVRMRNNVIVLQPGIPLLSPNSITSPLHAESNRIWWLGGKAPRTVHSGFTVTDPQLRDPAQFEFTPRPGGPAIGGNSSSEPAGHSVATSRGKARRNITAH